MSKDWEDDFVNGNLKKPSWTQYLQVSEEKLIERLNRGGMSTTEASWYAEKEIVAMVMAEKSRRRWRWYHAILLVSAVLSAVAAWVAALR